MGGWAEEIYMAEEVLIVDVCVDVYVFGNLEGDRYWSLGLAAWSDAALQPDKDEGVVSSFLVYNTVHHEERIHHYAPSDLAILSRSRTDHLTWSQVATNKSGDEHSKILPTANPQPPICPWRQARSRPGVYCSSVAVLWKASDDRGLQMYSVHLARARQLI